jgi:hypothetical protein
MFNPPGSSTCLESVTYDGGKDTYRFIKVTKIIAQHFMRRAREDEYIANEMRNALSGVEI